MRSTSRRLCDAGRRTAISHLSAVMQDQGGERTKEVLRRKANQHKASFLCKK